MICITKEPSLCYKKDSKATAESKYSVESTIDVAVKAGQEGMPAGMAKVLELLGSALDVVDAKGELHRIPHLLKTVFCWLKFLFISTHIKVIS